MRAKEFISEIRKIPQTSYTGGRSSLLHTKVPRADRMLPLPGGSGLLYSITKDDGEDVVLIIDPDHIDKIPPTKHRYEFDNEFNKRLKAWEKTAGTPRPTIVGRLSLHRTYEPIPNAVQVGSITVHEEYRGNGIARALYGIVLTIMKKTLVAGSSQTPGGRKNWMSLASIPGVEIKGYISIRSYKIDFDNAMQDKIMNLGGQFVGKDSEDEVWAFDVTPGDGELIPAVKNSLSKLYNQNWRTGTTGLYATWTGK